MTTCPFQKLVAMISLESIATLPLAISCRAIIKAIAMRISDHLCSLQIALITV